MFHPLRDFLGLGKRMPGRKVLCVVHVPEHILGTEQTLQPVPWEWFTRVVTSQHAHTIGQCDLDMHCPTWTKSCSFQPPLWCSPESVDIRHADQPGTCGPEEMDPFSKECAEGISLLCPTPGHCLRLFKHSYDAVVLRSCWCICLYKDYNYGSVGDWKWMSSAGSTDHIL